jgi:hypothetical protein
MERRNFLKSCLGVAFSPLFFRGKPRYRKAVIIDYSKPQKDELGYIYRRVLSAHLIPPEAVAVVEIDVDGSINVEIYDYYVWEDELQPLKRHYKTKPCSSLGTPTFMINIPKGDWSVSQYDGCGQELFHFDHEAYLI